VAPAMATPAWTADSSATSRPADRASPGVSHDLGWRGSRALAIESSDVDAGAFRSEAAAPSRRRCPMRRRSRWRCGLRAGHQRQGRAS
jgi:hypothetical protein